MSKPDLTVTVYFGTTATGTGIFHLNSSLLDGADVLGGDIGTEVSATTDKVTIRRGRPAQIFDTIDAADGNAELNNELRTYDPLYTAGAYYGLIAPGVRARFEGNGVVFFDGRAADWNYEYEVDGQSVAHMQLEDALAVLARQEFDEWTATASQAAGARLTDILNRPEVAWAGGARDIDTGVSVLQGDLVTWGSNVLNYCQLVAQSDYGQFFCSRDGLLTFRDRHANIGASVAVAFGTGGIPFQGIGLAFGAELFYNRVSVDRLGGIEQTYTTTTATTDGVRSLSLSGLLMDTDTQALDMATYLANIYASGETRVSMIRIMLDDDDLLTVAQIAQVLALDINSLISVTWTPNGVGTAISQTCVVQGIDHDIDAVTHTVTLALGKYDSRAPFILDQSLLNSADVLTF